VAFYGNPDVHTPDACGHLINDPSGTPLQANCIETTLLGGVVTAMMIVQPVRAGEELLMDYGRRYWEDRRA